MEIETQIAKDFLVLHKDGYVSMAPPDQRTAMIRVISDTGLFVLRAKPCHFEKAAAELALLVDTVNNLPPEELAAMFGPLDGRTRAFELQDNGKLKQLVK